MKLLLSFIVALSIATLWIRTGSDQAIPSTDAVADLEQDISSTSISRQGTYLWKSRPREPGALRAVFTPDGDSRWTVSFQFSFDSRQHTYRGTASGDLENGRLAGQVRNEGGARTFTFEGWSQSGIFNGKHAEISGRGREYQTGTMKLSPP